MKRIFIAVAAVAVLLAGCVAPTTSPKTPPTELLPPVKTNLPPVKAKGSPALPPPATIINRAAVADAAIAAPVTNVLRIAREVVIVWPTNKAEYALLYRESLNTKWMPLRLTNDTRANWRTTNGAMFEYRLPLLGPPTFYTLGTNYGLRLLWDDPETGIVSFAVYTGLASRTYTTTNVISSTAAKWGLGADFTYVFPSLPVDRSHFFAITARNASGMESDYSVEVVVPPLNK